MQPLLCPFNLAFEMTPAFCYARRLYDRRREGRKAGFLELIDPWGKFQANDPDLLEDLTFKGRNVNDKFLGRQNIVVGIFGSPGRESDVHELVAYPHASAVRGGVDPAFFVDSGDHDQTRTGSVQSIPMLTGHIDLFRGSH